MRGAIAIPILTRYLLYSGLGLVWFRIVIYILFHLSPFYFGYQVVIVRLKQVGCSFFQTCDAQILALPLERASQILLLYSSGHSCARAGFVNSQYFFLHVYKYWESASDGRASSPTLERGPSSANILEVRILRSRATFHAQAELCV